MLLITLSIGNMCFSLFCNLFLMHLLGDFYLQTDRTCGDKVNMGFRSKSLYIHGLIIFLLSWLALAALKFWWLALIVGLTHFIIDGIKSKCGDNLKGFIFDQLAHIIVMVLVAYCATKYLGWKYLTVMSEDQIFIIGALVFIICAKPSNVFIKKVLMAYSIDNQDTEEKSPFKAGGLIGTIERWLILVFIMLEQYEAVGFLLAAKSIIRFKDTETNKTEYVLAGTLISVAIAVACGLLINYK